jgi:hypothetical protein
MGMTRSLGNRRERNWSLSHRPPGAGPLSMMKKAYALFRAESVGKRTSKLGHWIFRIRTKGSELGHYRRQKSLNRSGASSV